MRWPVPVYLRRQSEYLAAQINSSYSERVRRGGQVLAATRILAAVLCIEASTAWATLTPVTRPDPQSPVLEPLRPGPTLTRYLQAIDYLKQAPLAARIIDWLQRSSVDYKVEILDSGDPALSSTHNEFDGVENVLRWQADTALEWHGNFRLRHAHSPAIGLIHELGHAFHKDQASQEFFQFTATQLKDEWGTVEEKRTIQEIENPVAKALGESERFFHDKGFYTFRRYTAVSSTSVMESPQPCSFLPIPSSKIILEDDFREALIQEIDSVSARKIRWNPRAG